MVYNCGIMYALGVALGYFGYTDVDKSYIILTVINWLLWTSKKQLVFILCVAQIHCFAKLWRTWSNRFANFREDMEIIWFGWQKRTQIRQGGPWPDRDQTVTGLNFGVTGLNFGVTGLNFGVTHPPPQKKNILWLCLAQKKHVEYKLGSISATAVNWNNRYLTAHGRLEALNSSKFECLFVAQRKTTFPKGT